MMVEGVVPGLLHRLLQHAVACAVDPAGKPLHGVGAGACDDLVGHCPHRPRPRRLDSGELDPKPGSYVSKPAGVALRGGQLGAVVLLKFGVEQRLGRSSMMSVISCRVSSRA